MWAMCMVGEVVRMAHEVVAGAKAAAGALWRWRLRGVQMWSCGERRGEAASASRGAHEAVMVKLWLAARGCRWLA